MNTKLMPKIKLSTLTVAAVALVLAISAFSGATTAVRADNPTNTPPPTQVLGGEGCAASATKLTWYIGLGSGTDAPVIPKEKAWADAFNKANPDVCLSLQIVHNPESYDTLKAMLAAGTPPDIVGPVGKLGRASFKGAWADVTPLAKAANVDLTKYDQTLLDFVKDDNVQVGLPFALFPAFIYYNKDLFDEAKLPYPPHKVGDKYQGKDWNLQTFTDLAKKLSVDANGADATDPKFDSKHIKQFGLWLGYQSMRRVASLFQPATIFDAKNSATIPQAWRDAYKWYYDGEWKDFYLPNADYANSDQFGKGNPFSSGNVAMTWSFTWYTCCFDMKKLNWDIAVVPTINGQITAGMHGDTFAIPDASKNKQAAFKVLSQMVIDKDLSTIYGGIPGNPADRASFFKAMDDNTAPNKIDWQVALDMLKYPDLPNHESWLPNISKAQDRFGQFGSKLDQTPGLDVDKEVDQLQTDLTAIFQAK
jgi:multiple sugar transport system substrate-binding protein